MRPPMRHDPTWFPILPSRRRAGNGPPMGLVGYLAMLVAAVASLQSPPTAVAGAVALPDDPTERVEGNNPTIAQKLLGYDAWVRAHGRAPDILVLGSSRAVMLDPVVIEHLSGRTSYNAAISSGAGRELLATASFADLRGGGSLPRLVVMLDLEAFDNRRPTTRVLDYQHRIDVARAACEQTPCRRAWLRAARAITLDAIARQHRSPRPYHETQRPDGRQINGLLARLEAEGADLDAIRDNRIDIRIRSYRRGGFDRIYPAPRLAFERMLELANERGIEPVVVLTAMHPDCMRRCGPAGWSARRAEVLALLDGLHEVHDFRTFDFTRLSAWGGTGADFYDEIHLRPAAAGRVVRRLRALGAFED